MNGIDKKVNLVVRAAFETGRGKSPCAAAFIATVLAIPSRPYAADQHVWYVSFYWLYSMIIWIQ
jgi:hypothetical protein